MGLLDRVFPGGHTAKVIEGRHPGNRPGTDENTSTADMLPIADERTQQGAQCKRHILVAVMGAELDRELVSLACNLAKQKKVDVYAIYGIEVPRTLSVDAEMSEETRQATEALDHATEIADKLNVHLEPEIIQSRHFGQSLVDESEAHACALVVLGLPYKVGRQGHFDLGEMADYVLKNAACRVWVVRGQPPEKAEKPDGAEQQDRQRVAAL